MRPQVKILAVMNPFDFVKAVWKFIFNINRSLGIMRQFFMWQETQLIRRNPQHINPPRHARFHPHLMIFFIVRRIYKVLHFRLFKFTHTEHKSTWGNFIPERLADLGNTERQLMRFCIQNIFEINICCCRRFRTQVRINRPIGRRPNRQPHHQLICTWFGNIRTATIIAFGWVFHFILAHTCAAFFAFDQWI